MWPFNVNIRNDKKRQKKSLLAKKPRIIEESNKPDLS